MLPNPSGLFLFLPIQSLSLNSSLDFFPLKDLYLLCYKSPRIHLEWRLGRSLHLTEVRFIILNCFCPVRFFVICVNAANPPIIFFFFHIPFNWNLWGRLLNIVHLNRVFQVAAPSALFPCGRLVIWIGRAD